MGPGPAVERVVGRESAVPSSRVVLTRHPRPPLELEGGTTFTFVTGGLEAALAEAKRAARGRDVSLAGGASTANQYLAAGLVDEMVIHLVPILLGAGERLFEGVSDLAGLRPVRTVATASVTHLKFARPPGSADAEARRSS